MNEIDIYISNFPVNVQERLKTIRKLIQQTAPFLTEGICMRMPTYYLNNKWLLHFAAFKNHISFFPQANGVAAFADKLTGYKTSKGTIQFPNDKPLPLNLISEIVKYKTNNS